MKTQKIQKADGSFLGKKLLVPTKQFLCPTDSQHMVAKRKSPADNQGPTTQSLYQVNYSKQLLSTVVTMASTLASVITWYDLGSTAVILDVCSFTHILKFVWTAARLHKLHYQMSVPNTKLELLQPVTAHINISNQKWKRGLSYSCENCNKVCKKPHICYNGISQT